MMRPRIYDPKAMERDRTANLRLYLIDAINQLKFC